MTAPNFHHLVNGQYLILVSYQTPVAALDQITGTLFVTSKRWSNTTTRHISKFRAFCKYPTSTNVEQGFIDTIAEQ